MAKLLAHLFDVTERFGMATRTELLLLQRTMVVVEGVARSLDPNMNMWKTAQPVVETYIKENIGPKAVLKDFTAGLQAISRFGPHLPYLIEKSLRKLLDEEEKTIKKKKYPFFLLGFIIGISFSFLFIILFIFYFL